VDEGNRVRGNSNTIDSRNMSALPQKRTLIERVGMSALCAADDSSVTPGSFKPMGGAGGIVSSRLKMGRPVAVMPILKRAASPIDRTCRLKVPPR